MRRDLMRFSAVSKLVEFGISVIAATTVCLALSAAVLGQTGTGRIVGFVQDQTGAAVQGATVVALNEDTNVPYTTVTSDAGKYTFEAMPPGLYTITAELTGFKKFSTAQNVVTANDTVTINVPLEAGNIAESVQVVATYERVQTSQSGNFGNTINEHTLETLPIAGRNPLALIAVQPGVYSGSNSTGNTHVFGSRDRAFNITLDGIDANETSAGTATFTPIRTNPDSLREYRVITSNPSAEFGRNSGAQVALITKSGTNEFHGTAFWYHRNRVLNANEWELNRQGIPRRFLLRNQWGGSIGGPIIKNKTFFFFNTQWQRQIQTLEQISTVYTADARRGVFRYVSGGRNFPFGAAGASVDAQGNPLPGLAIANYNAVTRDPRTQGLDPTVQGIISLTPLPNRFDVGDGLNTAGFTSQASRTDPQRDFNIRIDHTFNERNNLYGRFSFGQQDTVGDTTNSGAARYPGLPPIVATFRTPKNLAIGWRSTLSSQTVNELIVGGNRFIFDFAIPTNQDSRTTPIITVNFTDPLSNSFGNKRTINTYQVVDNLSHVRGDHTFRMGVNVRLQQHYDVRGSVAGIDSNPNYFLGGAVDPTTFQLPTQCSATITTNCMNSNDRTRLQGHINDILGKVNLFQVGLVADGNTFAPPGTGFIFDAWYPEFDLYFQDDWKIRPNLMINLGLRWEPKPKPYTRGGSTILVPNKPVVLGSAPADDITFVEGDLYKSDWNNFGPAIGVAWDPFNTGKTSVRGNFRIAFDRISTFLPSSAVFPNTPGTTFANIIRVGTTADYRLRDGIPSLAAPSTATPQALARVPYPSFGGQEILDPDFKTPTTYMWSVGVQREIGWKVIAEATYIGRAGRSLIGGYERNQVDIFNNGFLPAFITAKAGGESALLNQLTSLHPNRLPAESGAAFLRRFFATPLAQNNVASLAATLNGVTVTQGGVVKNLPDATAMPGGKFFFIPYPQFNAGGMQIIDSNSFSNYHGGVFQLSRRFEQGLEFNIAYTWSKSMDDKSYDPTFTRISSGTAVSAASTPFDANNRRLNYGPSDFDRTHLFQTTAIYELPFGNGKRWGRNTNGVVSRLIGGWTVTTALVWQSGVPFTAVSGTNTFSNRNSSRANFSGTNFHPVYANDPVSGVPFLFTPTERAQFSLPGPGELGNTSRNQFRFQPSFNMDASVIKKIALTETKNIEFRVQMFNLTNTPYMGFPSSGLSVLSGSTFSRDLTSDSFARVIEFAFKFNF
jgi:hypothetical protein